MLLSWYTETKRETTVPGAFSGVGRNKMLIVRKLAWIVGKLLPFAQRYIVKTRVTFGLTNGSGVVGHDRIANLFGTVRELFGLSRIPGFAKDVGQKYLLKTCDAVYQHDDDFHFGDIIKTIINVVEVNGASFKLRGRFINKGTGKVCATALQTVVYTNLQGRPVRFPKWLKILLELSCPQGAAEKKTVKKNGLTGGYEVFQRQVIVTSEMTNAEKNVNHDEYAKIFAQTAELFMINLGQRCSLKVREASYKYSHDFFFGDKIIIDLFIIEFENDGIVFEANFCDEAGKIHAYSRQKICLVS